MKDGLTEIRLFPAASLSLLRGLTCSAFPAGVFVLHSNQQLEQAITKPIKKSELIQILMKDFE